MNEVWGRDALRDDIETLKRELFLVRKELDRLERVEKSLGYHEVVIAKKIEDLHELKKRVDHLPKEHPVDEVKGELKKLMRQEEIVINNSRHTAEIARELEKLRESHKLEIEHHARKSESHRRDTEDSFKEIKNHLVILEKDRQQTRKEIMEKLYPLEKGIALRMDQIEDQNKLVMKYLKKIDEMFSKK